MMRSKRSTCYEGTSAARKSALLSGGFIPLSKPEEHAAVQAAEQHVRHAKEREATMKTQQTAREAQCP